MNTTFRVIIWSALILIAIVLLYFASRRNIQLIPETPYVPITNQPVEKVPITPCDPENCKG